MVSPTKPFKTVNEGTPTKGVKPGPEGIGGSLQGGLINYPFAGEQDKQARATKLGFENKAGIVR